MRGKGTRRRSRHKECNNMPVLSLSVRCKPGKETGYTNYTNNASNKDKKKKDNEDEDEDSHADVSENESGPSSKDGDAPRIHANCSQVKRKEANMARKSSSND